MRTAFVETLVAEAELNPDLLLLVGDLGFYVLDAFAQRFPDRFLNVGVAEQNMASVAAGMAMSGKTVFIYSIGNFPTLRCIEQIRNDICYHQANVKIVAVGGGLVYGALGSTHHATEDLAILRTLPHLTLVAPGDPVEARLATSQMARQPGPAYLRLGKTGEPKIHADQVHFQIGKAIEVRSGKQATIISTGGMLEESVIAADHLAEQGAQVRVLSMHTIKPLDTTALRAAALETQLIVTVEEHSVLGGLGGAVAEFVCENVPGCRVIRMGIQDQFFSRSGSHAFLRKQAGLTSANIATTVLNALVKESEWSAP